MSAEPVVWRLKAIPLTPIHVGDGSVLAPEDWKLDGDTLVRFQASAVLRAMRPDQRQSYLEKLDRGELTAAQDELRRHVRDEHVIDRVRVGAASRGQLEESIRNPLRRGEVRPFVRTAGRPFIPGSSIKGAIRTALLSALASKHRQDILAAKQQHPPPRSGPASDCTQRVVLGHASTDQDPFRFVAVSDVPISEQGTQVDHVVNWRPRRLMRDAAGNAEKIQMIYERLRARVDSVPLSLPLEIRIDPARLAAARRLDADKAPRLDLRPDELREAINRFHWRLFDEERERFFADEPATLKMLERMFHLKAADGKVANDQSLRRSATVLLLRIGRFGQFESKSIADFREGWNAQAKPPRGMTQGNTRNVVRVGQDQTPVPMGWLLCVGRMQ
jgi:CRISPR-associated protein Csm5